MRNAFSLITLPLCFLLLSCGNERSSRTVSQYDAAVAPAPAVASETETADSTAYNPGSLSDPSRKIIKTADMKCKVADVYAATAHIEQISTMTGGQISNSRLENTTDDVRTLPYSTDSLRKVSSYTTTAHLTLRIPVNRLDTVLSDIAARAAFIDSRNLNLDDVTLRYLSNKLKNDAMAANDAAIQARKLAKKSKEAVYSGSYADDRNDRQIDRRIENMQLSDQVAFATLTVDLYQPQRLSEAIVPDIDALMKPTIGQQAGIAVNKGWLFLRDLFIVALQFWPVILILSIVYWLYRLRRSRRHPLTARA